MGLLKSFKKVLKSPIGKAALGIGAFMYGPKLFGAGNALGGQGGWGQAWGAFSGMDPWKQALIAGGVGAGASAIGNEMEDKTEKVIDSSGHEGYLNSRKMFVDEWTQWLLDSDEDLSYEEARTQAERALFNKAQGGLIGLANGGAIEQNGYLNYINNSNSVTVPERFKARDNATPTQLAYITSDEAAQLKRQNRGTPHVGPHGIPSYDDYDASKGKYGTATSGEQMSAMERGDPSRASYIDRISLGYTPQEVATISNQGGKPPRRGIKDYFDSYLTKAGNTGTAASFAFLPGQKKRSHAGALKYLDYLDEQGVDTSRFSHIRNMDPKKYNVEAYNDILSIPGGPKFATNQVSPGHPSGDYNPNRDAFPMDYANWALTKEQMPGMTVSGDVGNFYRKENPEGAINPDTGLPFTNLEWNAFRDETVRDRGYETGREGPTWKQRGYPSEAAYLFSTSGGGGGGGGGGTGSTEGDYYGFKEWEDWTGAPTTPLFGDATTYQGLLSKGGRIGLYGGGMGGMNNSMNPMMNKGLGAMGSPGMNPYNQQNLMQQSQMRGPGGPQGRPPMPGGPNMAQGPGITGTQAAAQVAEKEQDTELLQLIRMLASLGIPMEQLRGRTKEELVEMVISVKSRTQPEGREEVVEEEQEEIMTAAHGGRVRAAGGLGEYPPQGSYPNSDLEFQTEAEASMGNPGNAEMYIEEDEEEQIYVPRAGGGLMRTRYAMGSEQPIIPSKDGPQIDYRGIGGYQPHGAKEKKDDVRALLAQGEFVVTSDAVKGIGGGDRDVGAKRMYDLMHKYEPVGRALS